MKKLEIVFDEYGKMHVKADDKNFDWTLIHIFLESKEESIQLNTEGHGTFISFKYKTPQTVTLEPVSNPFVDEPEPEPYLQQ